LTLKGEVQIEEPSGAERAIIRRCAESRATVPILELTTATPGEVATPRLVRACAQALRQHPRANAAYRDGHFELYSRVNVGVLLASEDVYVIPTVFDADRKDLEELAEEVDSLREEAIAGTLPPPALSGATFTVWNASELGLHAASIPVVSPQAAALAAGMRDLVLAADHRILYGTMAAKFLDAVRVGLA
jgi:pyruvate dehydrogenase E2 component (dihydrolipoamide acetyltransferase)